MKTATWLELINSDGETHHLPGICFWFYKVWCNMTILELKCMLNHTM